MNPNKQGLLSFILDVFPMPYQQAETIVGYFDTREISKNDFLFAQGKICKEYHFLEEGFIRSYTHDLDGNDVTTGLYSSKRVVCDIFSFFKHVPSKENFQALTECKTLFISFDELQRVFHSMPEFREFGRSILVNAYAELKIRMLSMFQDTAEDRYRKLLSSNPDIFQNAPLKNIASYLGVTNTSLSRIRKEVSKNILK